LNISFSWYYVFPEKLKKIHLRQVTRIVRVSIIHSFVTFCFLRVFFLPLNRKKVDKQRISKFPFVPAGFPFIRSDFLTKSKSKPQIDLRKNPSLSFSSRFAMQHWVLAFPFVLLCAVGAQASSFVPLASDRPQGGAAGLPSPCLLPASLRIWGREKAALLPLPPPHHLHAFLGLTLVPCLSTHHTQLQVQAPSSLSLTRHLLLALSVGNGGDSSVFFSIGVAAPADAPLLPFNFFSRPLTQGRQLRRFVSLSRSASCTLLWFLPK
jgi:hypothetical protein